MNRQYAAVVLLVVALATVGSLGYTRGVAECENRQLELGYPAASFSYTETTDGWRFRKERGPPIPDDETAAAFVHLQIVITDPDDGDGTSHVINWTTLRNGAYPVETGDTATLTAGDAPLDLGTAERVHVAWYGRNLGVAAYCDRLPILPDRELIRGPYETVQVNRTG